LNEMMLSDQSHPSIRASTTKERKSPRRASLCISGLKPPVYKFSQNDAVPSSPRFDTWLTSTQQQLGSTVMNDFASRVEAIIPRLRRYARALTRNEVAADDLVQDCLVRAVAKQNLWQEGTARRVFGSRQSRESQKSALVGRTSAGRGAKRRPWRTGDDGHLWPQKPRPRGLQG
jgi:Sigma-70 region 2